MKRTTKPQGGNEEEEPLDLSSSQIQVLASLSSGSTYLEAAAQAGIADRTIRRWRESCPAFEAAFRQQRHALRESAEMLVAHSMPKILRNLIDIASSPDHQHTIRAIGMMIDPINRNLPTISQETDLEAVASHQENQKFLRVVNRFC